MFVGYSVYKMIKKCIDYIFFDKCFFFINNSSLDLIYYMLVYIWMVYYVKNCFLLM